MKKTSQRPTIAEYHRSRQYQLMYGVTNAKGNANFRLTARNFSLNAGPAPVYTELVAIIKKYTFSLLGLKDEADAKTEIQGIQTNIDTALNLPKNLVNRSLKYFASTVASSQIALQSMQSAPLNINIFIKNNQKRINGLDKVGEINAKKFNMTLKEYQKYVDSAVGSVGDNISKFKKLLGNQTPKELIDAQIYVTTILRTKVGTLNEILTAQLFQSVAQLGTKYTLAGTNKSTIKLSKGHTGFKQISKGDFYYQKNNKLIFSSVKWTAKSAKKGILKATDSLSLLNFKNSAFSQFMVDIVNLRLSTLTSSSKNNKFIAALLADLAFLGYSGRPLFIVSTSYEGGKPKITVNFMYEIFQNYLDHKLYPSTTKIDFKYVYHSLKKNADFGYSGTNGPHGFEFYDSVPYSRTKNLDGSGAYMTEAYFNARVKSAAFTVKGKFKY